jgi:hypothetical protein
MANPSDSAANEGECEREVSASETHDVRGVIHSVLDIPASYHPPALLFTENTQLKADVNAPVHVSSPVSMPSQANSAAVCAALHRALM